MKTKCLIVDDEPLAIEVIKSHISKIDSFELAGACRDAFEAFNFLKDNDVDLMFLDIHMPEMKGTDLVKNLKNPPKVVLTTAHRQYAIEGFDLNVLDYLLKPVSFERFLQTVEKFNEQNNSIGEVSVHWNKPDEKYIYLREKNMIHKIMLSKIVYVESMGDYLTIHLQERDVTARCRITLVEEVLPDDEFIRIHRSFIVPLKKISSFSPTSVFVGEKEFPVGPSYKSNAFRRLDYNGFINS